MGGGGGKSQGHLEKGLEMDGGWAGATREAPGLVRRQGRMGRSLSCGFCGKKQ